MRQSHAHPSVAILQCGEAIDGTKETFGDYDSMCKAMLGLEPADAATYRVMDNVLPSHVTDHDLYVVTGSRHGAYDDHPWIAPLEAFIRAAHTADAKMIGICFGHQIIAQALGGRVEKSHKGFGIGLMPYQLTGLGAAPPTIDLYAWHQDQVIEAPDGAEIIAASDFCPIAGLRYGNQILTLQPHPEFSAGYEAALIEARRGSVIPNAQADEALLSLEAPSQSALMCRLLRDFAGLS